VIGFQGLLITCLGSIGRFANHLQNQVTRLLKRIASFGLAVQFRRQGNDCAGYVATAHGAHPHTWPPGPEPNSTTHLSASRSPVDNYVDAAALGSLGRYAYVRYLLTDANSVPFASPLNIRRLRKTSRVTTKEFLLNLNPDFVHPSFGPVGPVLEMADLRLKLPYPLFGGSKFRRYVVRRLVVCLGRTPCPRHSFALHRPLLLPPCRLNSVRACHGLTAADVIGITGSRSRTGVAAAAGASTGGPERAQDQSAA
jgi:hypothetical protein